MISSAGLNSIVIPEEDAMCAECGCYIGPGVEAWEDPETQEYYCDDCVGDHDEE